MLELGHEREFSPSRHQDQESLLSNACSQRLATLPEAAARAPDATGSDLIGARQSFCRKTLLRPPGHQFQSPRMRMVAGTRRMRMIVASTNTATASPSPMALVVTMPVKAKAPVTTMMMAAAEVMMPAVATSPFATLAVLDSPYS